jgi:hypothetical protein
MASLVLDLVDRFASALAKEIGKRVAKKLKEKHKDRIVSILSAFFGRKEEPTRKILLIGGGEIGTEIGLAALLHGWYVRAVCCVRDYPEEPDEKTQVAIKNLPFYTNVKTNEKKQIHYYTGEKPSRTERFQWTVLDELNIDVIKEIVVKERPDVVLLEDAFMTAEQWKSLRRIVVGDLKPEKKILFVPSTDEVCNYGKTYSDIFLSKIKMKEFLTEIGLGGHLLGKTEDHVEVENLQKENNSRDFQVEREKIQKLMKNHKSKVILKFDTTSSGHGQFILSDISFLDPAIISESVEYAKYRVPNKHYVVEKYLSNKEEVCAIVARTKEGKVGLNRIYYKKYDMEKTRSKRFRWVTRLMTSESRPRKDNSLWITLNRMVEQACSKLQVPFVYFEFIIDKSKKSQPEVYINEVSFRPDDAGFVSFLSHSKDQFALFMESLENFLEKEQIEDSQEVDYLETKVKFKCTTMNPGKKVTFLTDNLTWPLKGTPQETKFKLSLYEKYLYEKDGTIDYGRIIGYIWYPAGENPRELLGQFKSSLGLDDETYKTIFDTLDET